MAAPAPPPARRVPPLLAGAGLLVILGGFGLPRLFTTSTPAAAPAPAEPVAVGKPTPPADGPGLGMALGRFAVSLIVVCGLCVLAAKLLAKKPLPPAKGMAVTAALNVDPRCSVYLVTAGDRRLLLGVDPAGVKEVLELPGPPPEHPAAGGHRGIEEAAPATEGQPAATVVGPVRLPAALPDEIAAVLARLRQQAATP